MGKVSRPVLNARNTYVRYRGPYLTRPRPPLARERARECPVCCLPRSVKLGLRGLHKWFRSLSTTLLYPSVGQAWVTGVLGVSLVAGVLGVRGGETACLLSNFNFRFQFFFFKQKTAYEIMPSLVGSEMCIRDSSSQTRQAQQNQQST